MNAMDGWISVTTCPNCKGDALAPYKTVQTAPLLFVDFCGGSLPVLTVTNYVGCVVCGLVIQSPRMTDERINEYYASGLYRKTLGIDPAAMDADELQRAQDVAEWLKFRNVAPHSHLDIGASRGYLSKEIGANIRDGYDANPSYSDGLRVFDNKASLHTYDLVTSVHCLEHTIDPLAELEWYASLTTDKLYIEVPGEYCKGGPLRFAHLYYFPPGLLFDAVDKLGFHITDMETEPNTRILAEIE
jgi:hypothetical protein